MSDIYHENRVIADVGGGSGGGSGSGGHTILDPSDTAMTHRGNLKFGDYDVTDDETNDVTKIDAKKPKEKTWAQYQALPIAEQNDGSIYFIPDYPGVGGVFFFQTVAGMNAAISGGLVPNNAICVVEEDTPYVVNAEDVNYDNSDSGMAATKVQGAIDELNSNLSGLLFETVSVNFSAIEPASGEFASTTIDLTKTGYYLAGFIPKTIIGSGSGNLIPSFFETDTALTLVLYRPSTYGVCTGIRGVAVYKRL